MSTHTHFNDFAESWTGMSLSIARQVDQLAWLASVKIGSKGGSHSSETNSRVRLMTNLLSKPPLLLSLREVVALLEPGREVEI